MHQETKYASLDVAYVILLLLLLEYLIHAAIFYLVYFLFYKFYEFHIILKVAGEVMNVVVKAKNAMRVKVIVTPMTNVCRD